MRALWGLLGILECLYALIYAGIASTIGLGLSMEMGVLGLVYGCGGLAYLIQAGAKLSAPVANALGEKGPPTTPLKILVVACYIVGNVGLVTYNTIETVGYYALGIAISSLTLFRLFTRKDWDM